MLKDPARRCLVPFTSFAEPVIGGGRAEHWFTIRDRPLAAFAGIWRPTAEEGKAFAFLTCEPNPLVAPLHPKAMPVILPEADYRAWLTGDWDDTQALACPYPSQLIFSRLTSYDQNVRQWNGQVPSEGTAIFCLFSGEGGGRTRART